LVTVKADVQDLSVMLRDLNKRVQDSGEEVVETAQDLMEGRYMRKNISETLEALRAVQYVVSLATKAREHIAQRKFFSALKILDALQRVHLPRFADYDFVRHLEQQIPLMIRQIQDVLRKEFLENWLPA
jgi:exocyst complex component 6